MKIDREIINRFERELNPADINSSDIPVKVVGFGEISAIFQLDYNTDVVYKRMPLFNTRIAAEAYREMYNEYCQLLKTAGLKLPEDATCIAEHCRNRPHVLYIAQECFFENDFCHKRINRENETGTNRLIEQVAEEIQKVWKYNDTTERPVELALDGQLSNWACRRKNGGYDLYYVDTSTPLYKKQGVEQQNPELLLKSAPWFLRWIIRLFFLSDVMNRYYDLREVYKDLAANLFKEQREDLVPRAVEIINTRLKTEDKMLTEKSVEKYYKEDKVIWSLFLTFRRIDRFLKTRLLGSRYEFMLPGKTKR